MDNANLLTVKPVKTANYSFKRIFDVVVSVMLLIILSPGFLLIALLIRLTSEGPVIFKQKRIGLHGQEFWLYKFRTMVNNAEELRYSFTPEQQAEFEYNFKLKNDPRVTRLGKFLRKTSIDELPQFINVLRGEMSIVGPRPLTKYELEHYAKHKNILLSVKPGITGLSQVSGRSNLSYEQRFKLDIAYIRNYCFRMDLKIFMTTFFVIIMRQGAY